ncbi:glucosaminidase domain-containing protein [Ancylomarina longa]|uniref:Mannosyl-glycoprotein endo-beta-N-acetylglucosamidase-like domain-containing protein n=1 Tax=Ancylomarina longa TaxID=2487017 RepID=A0A434AYX0_9BACT|nr:glucosaminidase domain-containing protein [Ancylomarina longa]RUT79790.1 hypothetical protein DLK05_00075 [Ancylomarina longa]
MRRNLTPLIFILIFIIGCNNTTYKEDLIIPQYAEINTPQDVHSFDGKTIIPYIYTKVISLHELPVKEKKEKFINMLLPSILYAQHTLNQKIKRIEHIEKYLINKPKIYIKDSVFLNNLYVAYKCSDSEELKRRLKPHPASIVLGQAALESGWGSSRFFEKANNIFGIWSYYSGEDRIQALIGRDSTKIYVRKYANIEESVNDYFMTIATVNAYEKFRKERLESKNPFLLVPLLSSYSELRSVYTRKLTYLIKSNDLTKFDNYTLDEKYIKIKTVSLTENK